MNDYWFERQLLGDNWDIEMMTWEGDKAQHPSGMKAQSTKGAQYAFGYINKHGKIKEGQSNQDYYQGMKDQWISEQTGYAAGVKNKIAEVQGKGKGKDFLDSKIGKTPEEPKGTDVKDQIKVTGGNLVIKSGGSNVFNINSSSGITQSIKSSLSNSTTVTGFNQTQLNDSNLLKVNKTFTGDQTSENISKAVIFSSTFDSTLNKNKNNTLYVDSTHSGISTTGGTFHNHNKTTQNFAGTFNATHNTESRLSSYGINATSTTQQLGYNIGGFFEASNAGFENSGVIAVGSGSNSVNVGVFGTVDQTRDQIGTYMKSTLYDSLSGIKAGVFGYNPSTSANNYALYTSGYNYLGGNTKLNGTLSVSGISKFYSDISLDNSSITYTDGTDTYSIDKIYQLRYMLEYVGCIYLFQLIHCTIHMEYNYSIHLYQANLYNIHQSKIILFLKFFFLQTLKLIFQKN